MKIPDLQVSSACWNVLKHAVSDITGDFSGNRYVTDSVLIAFVVGGVGGRPKFVCF